MNRKPPGEKFMSKVTLAFCRRFEHGYRNVSSEDVFKDEWGNQTIGSAGTDAMMEQINHCTGRLIRDRIEKFDDYAAVRVVPLSQDFFRDFKDHIKRSQNERLEPDTMTIRDVASTKYDFLQQNSRSQEDIPLFEQYGIYLLRKWIGGASKAVGLHFVHRDFYQTDLLLQIYDHTREQTADNMHRNVKQEILHTIPPSGQFAFKYTYLNPEQRNIRLITNRRRVI